MNTTVKGNAFETKVAGIIEDLLNDGSFYLDNKSSKIFRKKAYYSKDRNDNIVTDISIETFVKNSDKYSLLTILECKDLSQPIPIDDLEEFDSKLRQIGEHNLKGIFISKSGFQKSSIAFSKSKGIGLINIKENEEIQWVNFRKDKIQKQYNQVEIENKLCHVDKLETNFFALFDFKSFDYFPLLLVEIGIIDYFENRPKYFNLPYLEMKQICYIVDQFVNHGLYKNEAIDFKLTCEYLSNEFKVNFDFDKPMSGEILGKISLQPLTIAINPMLNSEIYRWRFTLAHEIGHLVLHREYLKSYVSENYDNENHISLNFVDSINFNKRLEIQANLFAGELLMPITLLAKHVFKYFEDENLPEGYLYLDNQPCNQLLVYNCLRILQMKFEVSLEVAKIRLINLNLLQDTTDTSLRSILKKNLK